MSSKIDTDSTNKTVAKNTLILYCRMVVTMTIGMWTSRLVLNALGFTDQGLYNVVGGFVGLSGLITGSISSSISRFITFEIGRGNLEMVNKAIKNASSVQWILVAILLLLAETIGLWFVNHELVIPADRLFTVNIVFQFAIGNIVVSILSSTPNAIIIAYERFSVIAYVAIANAIVSLLIAFTISYSSGDRLILYSALLFIAGLGTRIFYVMYCHRAFPNLKNGFALNKSVFLPIFQFAGWNGIGSSAAILRNSGTSILLNIFGGPIANTINGIANSISNLATIFVNDFTTAYNPQITKRYAAGQYRELIPFVHQCSKITYFLMAVMAIPIFFNVEPLLILWLKKIPDDTSIFARLIMIYLLLEAISRPMIAVKSATGNIRNYHLVVGGILLLTIPISYCFLKFGLPLYYSYIAIILTSSGAFVARLVMLRGDIPYWSTRQYVVKTLLPCILATAVGIIIPFTCHVIMPGESIWSLLQCLIGFVWCVMIFYCVAFNRHEKEVVKGFGRKLLAKVFKRI